jgi:hypothetical protein
MECSEAGSLGWFCWYGFYERLYNTLHVFLACINVGTLHNLGYLRPTCVFWSASEDGSMRIALSQVCDKDYEQKSWDECRIFLLLPPLISQVNYLGGKNQELLKVAITSHRQEANIPTKPVWLVKIAKALHVTFIYIHQQPIQIFIQFFS